jgi:hypothetical protein
MGQYPEIPSARRSEARLTPDGSYCSDEAGYEDSATAAKPVVEGVGQPARKDSATKIRGRVDQALEGDFAVRTSGKTKEVVVKDLCAIC